MKHDDDKALYLLPFDHRYSCVKNLFGMTPLLSAPQIEWLTNRRLLNYERVVQAIDIGVPLHAAGIPVAVVAIDTERMH